MKTARRCRSPSRKWVQIWLACLKDLPCLPVNMDDQFYIIPKLTRASRPRGRGESTRCGCWLMSCEYSLSPAFFFGVDLDCLKECLTAIGTSIFPLATLLFPPRNWQRSPDRPQIPVLVVLVVLVILVVPVMLGILGMLYMQVGSRRVTVAGRSVSNDVELGGSDCCDWPTRRAGPCMAKKDKGPVIVLDGGHAVHVPSGCPPIRLDTVPPLHRIRTSMEKLATVKGR